MDSWLGTVGWVELVWTLPALIAVWRYGERAAWAMGEQRRLSRRHYRVTLRLREQLRAEKWLFLMFASECMALLGLYSLVSVTPRMALLDAPGGWTVPLLLIAMQWAIILVGEVMDRHEERLVELYDREAAGLDRTPGETRR